MIALKLLDFLYIAQDKMKVDNYQTFSNERIGEVHVGICFAGSMSASGTVGGTDVGSAAAATTRTFRPCIFLAKI